MLNNFFKSRDLVLLHGWSTVGRIPLFIWRRQDNWFMRLYGITFDVQTNPDTKMLHVAPEPVYAPFFSLERHTGQLIIDIYAWTKSCITIVLTKTRPWVWITHYKNTMYKFIEDEEAD